MNERLRDLSLGYLEGAIPLPDFQQQFAGIYFQVRRNRNLHESASRLCDQIVGPLAELSRGHLSEDSFRAELTIAIRPFVYASPMEVV